MSCKSRETKGGPEQKLIPQKFTSLLHWDLVKNIITFMRMACLASFCHCLSVTCLFLYCFFFFCFVFHHGFSSIVKSRFTNNDLSFFIKWLKAVHQSGKQISNSFVLVLSRHDKVFFQFPAGHAWSQYHGPKQPMITVHLETKEQKNSSKLTSFCSKSFLKGFPCTIAAFFQLEK